MRSIVSCWGVMVCLSVYGVAAEDGVPESDALFKQLDSDGDGQLTGGEISEDKRALFDRLVRKADDNKDGKLSLKEFQAAHQDESSPNLPLNGLGGGQGGRGGDLRQRFEMLDRNKDGKVTRDEIPEQARQRLAPLFERLGKDALTAEDLRRAGPPDGERPETNRPSGSGPRGPVFMRLLDADRDGRISKAEWAKAGDSFAELDENGDGELDHRELMGPPPEEMANDRGRMARPEMRNRPTGEGNTKPGREFFARIDANGDGKLSKDEAPPRMRERFDRIDANKDDSLTPEELRAAFQGENPGGRPNPQPGGPDRSEGRPRPKRPAAE